MFMHLVVSVCEIYTPAGLESGCRLAAAVPEPSVRKWGWCARKPRPFYFRLQISFYRVFFVFTV